MPCVYDVVASFYEELAVVCKNDNAFWASLSFVRDGCPTFFTFY